jgi:hypothetical protein
MPPQVIGGHLDLLAFEGQMEPGFPQFGAVKDVELLPFQ